MIINLSFQTKGSDIKNPEGSPFGILQVFLFENHSHSMVAGGFELIS